MIWQPEFTDKTLSRKPGAVHTEDRIALLLGHERGSTESFKTYSKNAASPIELQPYIELLRYPEIETEP